MATTSAATWRKLLSMAAGLVWERRWSLETRGEVELDELDLEHPERTRYEPAPWLILRRILSPLEVHDDDVFIDYGSGKGRMLFLAGRYPFRRVIGVEISDRLNAIARGNIERSRRRLRCKDVEVITADAAQFVLPDDVTVVFFNNPFTGDIFKAVVDQLVASVERRPRRLRIIYAHYRQPEVDALLQTGRVVQRREGRRLPVLGTAGRVRVRMFEMLPSSHSLGA